MKKNTRVQYDNAKRAIMDFVWRETPQGSKYWDAVYRALDANAEELVDVKYRDAIDADIPKVEYPQAEFSDNGKTWKAGKLIAKEESDFPFIGVCEYPTVCHYKYCRIKVSP